MLISTNAREGEEKSSFKKKKIREREERYGGITERNRVSLQVH